MSIKIYKLGNMTVVDDPSKEEKEYYLSRYCRFGFDGDDVCWINYLVDNKLIYKGGVSGIVNFYGKGFSTKDELKDYLLLVVGVLEQGDYLGDNFLLDTYTNSLAGYSLRKLSGSATLAVEVRRDSDNAITDVFLESSGSVNLSSSVSAGGTLGDWVGGNSAFISNWYDQSGNADNAKQTVRSLQPILVNLGVLEMLNGKGALEFNGANFLIPTGLVSLANSQYKYISSVGSTTLPTDRCRILHIGVGTSTRVMHIYDASSNISAFSGNTFGNSVTVTGDKLSQMLLTGQDVSGNQSIFANGVAGGTNTSGGVNSDSTTVRIGGDGGGGQKLNGKLQELVIYNTDQSSNRAAIEADINNFYSIY